MFTQECTSAHPEHLPPIEAAPILEPLGRISLKAFRELPTQQIWVPRGFHDFLHVVSREPQIPDGDVMRSLVREYRRNYHLYVLVNESIKITERVERAHYNLERDILVDVGSRRTYRSSVLEERRDEFVRAIEENIAKTGEPNLTELSVLEFVKDGAYVTARNALSAEIARSGSRRIGLPVSLPIDRRTLSAT